MEQRSSRVLVTGATGFIGRRLVPALLAEGHRVRCLVRRPEATFPAPVEVVRGDLVDNSGLMPALRNIDTAYYLVHSLAAGQRGFERRDRQAAEHFRLAATQCGVRRVIYLGGLGEEAGGLSDHLASRMEVAAILSGGTFRTTVLRAAVIIGAGGASFEMIRWLVERLPVMITPRWVSTRCQPIAVDDVIRYLVGCAGEEETAGGTFDIGGPEILTYREMMERFARLDGKSPVIFPVPFLTPKLSAYWVALVTPVRPSISMPLIEGLRTEVICRENRIRDLLPFPLTPFDAAVKNALAEERITS